MMWGQWDNMMGNGWAWAVMLMGGLLFLGLLALIIFLIVRVAQGGNRPNNFRQGPDNVHQFSGREGGPRDNARALEILDERYARGEINDQEYVKMKNELKK